MSDNAIRIGVIGAGANTRDRHIPGLLEQENVEMVAVANPNVESGRRVAERSVSDVLPPTGARSSKPRHRCRGNRDLALMHCTATVAALEAGKHVMWRGAHGDERLRGAPEYRTAQARRPRWPKLFLRAMT